MGEYYGGGANDLSRAFGNYQEAMANGGNPTQHQRRLVNWQGSNPVIGAVDQFERRLEQFLRNPIIEGSITASSFSTAVSGRRIEMLTDGSAKVRFYSGVAGEDDNGVISLQDVAGREVAIWVPPEMHATPAGTYRAQVFLYSRDNTLTSKIDMFADDYNFFSAGTITLGGIVDATGALTAPQVVADTDGFREESGTNVMLRGVDTDTSGSTLNKYIDFTSSDDTRRGFIGFSAGIMFITTDGDNDIRFRPNSTDLMFLDAGADTVGIGAGPLSARRLHVYTDVDGNLAQELHTDLDLATGSRIGQIIRIGTTTADPGTNDSFILFRRGDQTTKGSVTGNGSGGVAFNTTSDERLKTSLELNPDVGHLIDGIDLHRFVWDENGVEDYGVFAQQAYTVYPQAISPGHESTQGTWFADYSKFVPLLIAEAKSARSRISQLEQELAELRAIVESLVS